MSAVTQLLRALEQGDARAADQLLPLVYDDLRRLARQKLAQEKPGQTLEPTALVHEAYLRLVPREAGKSAEPSWETRGHFFAAAAEAMRRILIESARRKRRLKRDGDRQKVDLENVLDVPSASSDDFLALNEALDLLAAEDKQKAELVTLRCFGGLSVVEAGRCLGISRATADRYWAYARAWLYDRLRSNP